jgi:hypothetical protein
VRMLRVCKLLGSLTAIASVVSCQAGKRDVAASKRVALEGPRAPSWVISRKALVSMLPASHAVFVPPEAQYGIAYHFAGVPTWHDRQKVPKCTNPGACTRPDAYENLVATFVKSNRFEELTDAHFAQPDTGARVGVLFFDGGGTVPAPFMAASVIHLRGSGMNPTSWKVLVNKVETSLAVKPSNTTGSPDATLLGWERNRPVLGVRCGSRWCWIALDGDPIGTIPMNCPGGHSTEPTCTQPGWSDEQYLTKPDGAGGFVPGPRARIIPVEGLATNFATLDKFATYTQIATIIADEDYETDVLPPEKDPDFTAPIHMRLKSGENKLYLQRRQIPANDGTMKDDLDLMDARIVFPDGTGDEFVMRRTGHERPVPGIARWKWSGGDEGLWTSCAAGCCELGRFTRSF